MKKHYGIEANMANNCKAINVDEQNNRGYWSYLSAILRNRKKHIFCSMVDYPVIFRRLANGNWIISFPDFPSWVSKEMPTYEAAVAHAKEMLRIYFATYPEEFSKKLHGKTVSSFKCWEYNREHKDDVLYTITHSVCITQRDLK